MPTRRRVILSQADALLVEPVEKPSGTPTGLPRWSERACNPAVDDASAQWGQGAFSLRVERQQTVDVRR